MTARIEYRPLSRLVGWEGNPKKHDVAKIKKSIERFGFVSPIVLDEGRDRIVAGHGRVSALRALKAAKAPAPAHVVVEGREWLVPCLLGVTFATDADAEAFILADNRLVELGGWDEQLAAAMAARVPDELRDLVAFELDTPDVQLDDAGDFELTEKKTRTKSAEVCPTCKGTGKLA